MPTAFLIQAPAMRTIPPLDRKISVMDAVRTSWRVIPANPAPMALWAGLNTGLTGAGIAAESRQLARISHAGGNGISRNP